MNTIARLGLGSVAITGPFDGEADQEQASLKIITPPEAISGVSDGGKVDAYISSLGAVLSTAGFFLPASGPLSSAASSMF
jgi:hypothetical protein